MRDEEENDVNFTENYNNTEDTNEEDEKLKDNIRKSEAASRMVFDDNLKVLDMRKRKVRDLPQNSKVFLPPPLNPILEEGLSIRKQEIMNTFADFTNNNCDDKGRRIKSSLSFDQKKGLDDVKKRTKEGDVVVLETDKTSKFVVVSVEKYLEMERMIRLLIKLNWKIFRMKLMDT